MYTFRILLSSFYLKSARDGTINQPLLEPRYCPHYPIVFLSLRFFVFSTARRNAVAVNVWYSINPISITDQRARDALGVPIHFDYDDEQTPVCYMGTVFEYHLEAKFYLIYNFSNKASNILIFVIPCTCFVAFKPLIK